MNIRPLPLLLCALALAACQPAADEPLDPDTLTMEELAITVESSIDELDASAEEGESDDVLMDLEADEDAVAPDRPGRRRLVRRLVTRLAEDEPCALRGVLAGRYHRLEDSPIVDGSFRGRAYRRGEGLVARGAGTYVGGDEPGGSWASVWENFEGDTGSADGTYAPGGTVDGIRLGTFDGEWEGDDGPGFGNISGLWHPTRDGRGVFIGYWSNCALTPAPE